MYSLLFLNITSVAEAEVCEMPVSSLAKIFSPTIIDYSCPEPNPEMALKMLKKQHSVNWSLVFLLKGNSASTLMKLISWLALPGYPKLPFFKIEKSVEKSVEPSSLKIRSSAILCKKIKKTTLN